MPNSATPSYEALRAIAYHTEIVKSNRLAKTMAIPIEQALQEILLQSLSKTHNTLSNLSQLVDDRSALLQKKATAIAAQREQSQQRHHLKMQSKTIPSHAWCLWFDGSAKPNPGKCSIGVVLQAPNGQQKTISQQIADGDSSYAEYQALIAGLKMAIEINNSASSVKNLEAKIERLYVIGDSQVVLSDVQIQLHASTQTHTKNASFILKEYRLEAQSLIKQLNDVVFMWKPRHNNAQADTLSQNAFSALQ